MAQAYTSPPTLAASQGVIPCGRVATYNVGASMEGGHTGKTFKPFREKLALDLGTLAIKAKCNIICLQEVNPFWHDHIKDMLPAHWASILGARSKVLTLYDTNHFTIERHQENRCFPDLVDQNNVYRHWRRWLEVVV